MPINRRPSEEEKGIVKHNRRNILSVLVRDYTENHCNLSKHIENLTLTSHELNYLPKNLSIPVYVQ